MKEKKLVYQQGDVLLYRAEIPENAVIVKPRAGRLILAEGEATGHMHAIEATPNVSVVERDGVLYLRVEEESATLVHEEHHAQTIAPGTYEVGIVREVDPFSQEVREVAD